MKNAIFLSSFIYTFGIGLVVADDIEIYVGTNDLNTNKANVLLMVDTSGSMDYLVQGTNQTRMQQTKKALKEMISKLPDTTNVGLGRYNDPGGSILYPIRQLDSQADFKVIKTITTSENDAVQESNGSVILNSPTMNFLSGVKNVISKITNSNDDVEQCLDGSSYLSNASYVDINIDATCLDANGLMFRNLNIPKKSKIADSFISMRLASNSPGNADSEIFVENTPSPANYANSNGRRLIDRNFDLSTTVLWQPVPSATTNTWLSTPSLKTIVQKMVNRNDWSNSSVLNFMFRYPILGGSIGTRTSFYSYDYTTLSQPYLDTTYYDSATSKTLVALRFDDLQIPSGAKIKNATIKLKSSLNNESGDIRIRAESNINPSPYLSVNNSISSRSLSNQSVTVPYTDWELNTFKDFDITSIIQDKVDSNNWCGGNTISLIIDSSDAYQIYSFDSGSINAPSIEIEFSDVPDNTCSKKSTIVQVNQNNDDGNQRSNNNVYLGYDELEISNTYPLMALRFNKLDFDSKTIQNLEIEDAYIELIASKNQSGSFNFNIKAEKIANSATLSNSKSSISSKTKTSNSVTWSGSNSFTAGTSYRSPDISAVLKEITNQSGWSSNNSITFILERSSGTRKFLSNDYSLSKSAKLVVNYKGNGSYKGISVREHLSNLIESLPAEGNTPLEGALYESGLYFLGEKVDYGRTRNRNGSSYENTKRISEDNTYINGTRFLPAGCSLSNLDSNSCLNEFIQGDPLYQTPMSGSACEVNSLIMITDGYPNSYSNYTSNLKNPVGVPLSTRIKSLTGKNCNDPWSCATVVAQHLYENDLDKTIDGKQNIFTHMIGFAELDSEGKLTDLARKGGGMFIGVNNNDELVSALTKIFNNILDVNTTLASPGVAVNQNNRFEHLSDIYYSVFRPSARKSWYGNIKKYRVDSKNVQIVDSLGQKAINQDTGFFNEGTKSFWSDVYDGEEVSAGGAAGRLIKDRKVFTYTDTLNSPNNSTLNSAKNLLKSSNSSITKDLFNLDNSTTNADFTNFVNWASGTDVNDEDMDGSIIDSREFMGDPLHSRPILINYEEGKDIVYVSTNNGFLHAIDAETGNEYFSFIPQELLPNLYKHYEDDAGDHLYGLDGSWVALRHDENGDGNINATGDYIYLYGGMRMGGRNYYALDVTNISIDNPQPKYKWQITPNTNAAFNDMGQTWSEPVITKIKLNNVEKKVLIFGGGYDTGYEDSNYNAAVDSLGKQVYMVDAITGELLWWSSNSSSNANTKINGMNYSITAKPTVIDLDNDGFADVIYIGDLGGQVLKFNINDKNTGKANFATGKIVAKIGVSDTTVSGVSKRRKIYEPITATRVKRNGEKYMSLIVGTGYRSRPLNKEIDDVLVVIKDKENYYTSISEPINTPLKLADLSNVSNSFDTDLLTKQLTKKPGYFISFLESNGSFVGEKLLGEQIVYDNKIIFTTYIPDGYATRCYPIAGFSRSYQISLFDGSPANSDNIENPNSVNHTDRYSKDIVPGISSGSKIIYTKDGVIELVNTQTKELAKGGDLGVKRVRWYKDEK